MGLVPFIKACLGWQSDYDAITIICRFEITLLNSKVDLKLSSCANSRARYRYQSCSVVTLNPCMSKTPARPPVMLPTQESPRSGSPLSTRPSKSLIQLVDRFLERHRFTRSTRPSGPRNCRPPYIIL